METEKIKAYKGFNSDLTCRDFQYEVGKEYEQKGKIKIEVCENGFHACENPMDVFGYYPPNNSRYCEVEQSGTIDSVPYKIASSKIRIQCEIGLSGIIRAGVKFILDKVNWKDDNATNTGNHSVATNTGYRSVAKVEGKESIAIVTGRDSKACGTFGCWLVLTERNECDVILQVKAVRVDGETIKENTWYKLKDGQIIETE